MKTLPWIPLLIAALVGGCGKPAPDAVPDLTPVAPEAAGALPVTPPTAIHAPEPGPDALSLGIREALSIGLQEAVNRLGQPGGFLSQPDVKIPIPESLQQVESLARRAGQGDLVDTFVATLNRAAEQAVPLAAPAFGDALAHMNLTDIRAILHGPDDAATQYFRKSTESALRQEFLPVVKQKVEQTGVTAAYQQLVSRASAISPFLKFGDTDLESYVTEKALDGLFLRVAEEEKRIRRDPASRGSELLQQVFSLVNR